MDIKNKLKNALREIDRTFKEKKKENIVKVRTVDGRWIWKIKGDKCRT